MTTTTNMGQIERVARVLYAANLHWRVNDGWGYEPDWENESGDVHHYWVEVAEAAIAACLPDRAAFRAAVLELMATSLVAGRQHASATSRDLQAYFDAVIALVYGGDA